MTETITRQLNDAMALQVAGRMGEAESLYNAILEVEPDNPDANHLLGLIFSDRDENTEAVALIERAIDLRPDSPPYHHNIAGIYRRLGSFGRAEAEFRRAIALKPDYGEAYQGLAELVTFERSDPFIRRVATQLDASELERGVRCYFHFAAGKFLDDVGDYSAAFKQYRLGNQAANKPFDSAKFRQQVKDTIYVFSREYVDRLRDTGNASEQPVFILGMPRSGTTLVEQILSSHSRVYGAGELNDMKSVAQRAARLSRIEQPWPNCVPGLTALSLGRLSEDYLNRIAQRLPGRYDRVIDKQPLNFQFLGLILLLFPRAKVIHMKRDPLDTCLSCYFQNFARGQQYSFDLTTLAHFYNDYLRLMEHWETVFPGRILTVEYERVVADQGAETARVLDYCGLEFEPACIEFHKFERAVKTASAVQVRQPIYKTSQKRWRRYSHELQPLADILGIPLIHPVTISGTNSILR